MGSNCSSLRRNGKKDEESGDNGPLNESDSQRKSSNHSVESLPYGRNSCPPSPAVVKSSEPISELNCEREAPESESCAPTAKEDIHLLGLPVAQPATHPHSPSPCPSSQTPSPYATPSSAAKLQPSVSPDLSHLSSDGRHSSESQNHENVSSYTHLFSIKDDNNHLIAISSQSNELIVWSIYEERAVRTLRGISQPRDVKMIDRYQAIVLCNRELKLYNLDSGTLETKLKGVMNQKMPYFGLHDENYVVALSRNRMYVNMINSKTGDLETTFKVGEDRFLNSLLVSANGKICVCGDETQKPFPLLVWDLANRKLLYDLRIPHHEFITRLSAISNDGHYVVSVCKEANTSSPNFIIVYDLQSGTLFKKWKPEHNSVSIAISAQCDCVINGVENTHVLVWDLMTDTKKYTLTGHTSAPDVLQASESGNLFLSYDSSGKDKSIRIWELNKGTCLTVYTPDSQISCCRLSPDGKALVVGLLSALKLLTVFLEKSEESKTTAISQYGDSERDGNIFDLI